MNKKGFTLVELLAVIVILTLIIGIIVPIVMNVIKNSTKTAMENSAKLVAQAVEKAYELSMTKGNKEKLLEIGDCMTIGNLDQDEYKNCYYSISENGKATVTIIGNPDGNFSGLMVKNATSKDATCTKLLQENIVTMEYTVKNVAYIVEKSYEKGTITDTYGNCMTLASLNTSDYSICEYDIDINGSAKISIQGASNSNYGGYACIDATKSTATCTEGHVVPVAVSFGTDTWETVVNAVKKNKYSVYSVGDTKEVDMGDLGIHTIRIANMSTPSECSTEGYSETACGFVLEFADIITTHQMNSTRTSDGGWPATSMRAYLNDTIYNALPKELGEGIIDTTVISGHGSDSNSENTKGNWESIDKLYLLSTLEVWGTAEYDTLSETETRQLDYYKNNNVTLSNNKNFAVKKNQVQLLVGGFARLLLPAVTLTLLKLMVVGITALLIIRLVYPQHFV